MFGFSTAKEFIKKSLNAVRLFQTIDLVQMKKNVDEIAKFKEKLKHLQFILVTLLILTLVNTILIMVILFKK
jgi:hypothetical protein